MSQPRLLVFVIAYYAETTLERGARAHPARRSSSDYDCEVLVVDDASSDRTFEIGREYRAAHPEIPMTVLRNEYNQGYGGNQKVGYAYAHRARASTSSRWCTATGSTRPRSCRALVAAAARRARPTRCSAAA